jgi:hypothetical protein
MSAMTPLKRLLNRPEKITHRRLDAVCSRHAAHVHAKVRLADVLPVEGSGISDEPYDYALRSHYDFVVSDSEDRPLFAVEFDGPSHDGPIQGLRDSRKGNLSDRFGLPLLRIRARDLHRTEESMDRLTAVVEEWFSTRRVGQSSAAIGHVTEPEREARMGDQPRCPDCQAAMVMKNGKYGPFWSCVRYPECRGSCDLAPPGNREIPTASPLPSPAAMPQKGRLFGASILAAIVVSALGISLLRGRHHDGPPAPTHVGATVELATQKQVNLLHLLLARRGWSGPRREEEIRNVLGYTRSLGELSKKEATKLITAWDDRGGP